MPQSIPAQPKATADKASRHQRLLELIVQETGIEAAITKVKTQHPQETGKLEVLTVGGILVSDQVISLDTTLL